MCSPSSRTAGRAERGTSAKTTKFFERLVFGGVDRSESLHPLQSTPAVGPEADVVVAPTLGEGERKPSHFHPPLRTESSSPTRGTLKGPGYPTSFCWGTLTKDLGDPSFTDRGRVEEPECPSGVGEDPRGSSPVTNGSSEVTSVSGAKVGNCPRDYDGPRPSSRPSPGLRGERGGVCDDTRSDSGQDSLSRPPGPQSSRP